MAQLCEKARPPTVVKPAIYFLSGVMARVAAWPQALHGAGLVMVTISR
jgi:hypothetical protein